MASPLGYFISSWVILIVISIWAPCWNQALNDPTNQGNCLETGTLISFFDNAKGFFGNNFITDFLLSAINIVAALVVPLGWSIGVPTFINFMLEILRIIAYICIYYIAFPTK